MSEQSTKKEITLQEFRKAAGDARAKALSPERRKEIATLSSHSRKCMQKIPKATHIGELSIGDIKISCAVLQDGTRLITQNSMWSVTGKSKGGSRRKPKAILELEKDGGQVPSFIAVSNLIPFMSNDLKVGGSPIEFVHPHAGKTIGYKADLIPQICEAYLSARDAGNVLTKDQLSVAKRSEIIMRSLARLGITALVDECTGYQKDRARDELQIILSKYISEELLKWAMKFPHSFFEQAYRILGWEYKPKQCRHPQYLGRFINKFIYDKLPPGVKEELQNKNPVTDAGHRAYRHHQFLTEDVGNSHLNSQIITVTSLMRAADNKEDFIKLFEKAYPS